MRNHRTQITCTICVFLLCGFTTRAQDEPNPAPDQQKATDDPAALLTQATAAYTAKQYAKSVKLYEAAMQAGAKTTVAPYNAACCYALLGKTDDAFAWLDKAIEAGWRNVEHLKADTDFKSLHADPRWAKAIEHCEQQAKKFAKSIRQPNLRAELLKRMREDQRIRTATQPDMQEWQTIDAGNTAFMKTVIAKYGWPGKSLVGTDGSQAAFLMIQHADADPKFQRRCLKLLTTAVQDMQASAKSMAYLTDRVLVAEGKPQRYGTQFFSDPGGEVKPRPIEDEANLDARREAVGLGPFADYAKLMRSMQQP